MAYYTTSVAYSSTGVKTITCGFQPVGMRITVGALFGSDTTAHMSVGTTDGTRQNYFAFLADGTGRQSNQTNTKMAGHLTRISGTVTEVVEASFDSFTATQGKFNLTKADPNYTLIVELWS